MVDASSSRERTLALGEALVVALALALLFDALGTRFVAALGTALNEDVPGWLSGARASTFFYDSGEREPLHAAALKLALVLVPPDERAARLTTVVMTLVLAVASWWTARRVLGRVPALVVLVLLSVNPVVASYGVGGLREPLQSALGIGIVGAALWMVERPGRIGPAVVTGVVGAALLLTRRYSGLLSVAAPLLSVVLVTGAQRREALRGAVIAVLVCVALSLPRVFVAGDHGPTDLAWFVAHNRAGLGGVDALAPAPPGFADALLEGRGVAGVAVLLVGNAARLLTWYLPHWLRGYEAAWLLVPVGVIVDVVRRRGFVSVCAVFAIAAFLPVLHLNPVAGRGGVEMRFIEPFFPFALVLIVGAVSDGVGLVVARRRRQRPEPAPPVAGASDASRSP